MVKIWNLPRILGVRGCLRSPWLSLRHTGRPDSIVVHSNVLTSISQNTQFNIENRLMVGVTRRGMSHPRLSKTKFSTQEKAQVTHSGSQTARIGPGCVLHIEGNFSIGDSYINSNSRILCGDHISIGDGCAIAWNVDLLDDDRHNVSIDEQPQPRTAPIKIQDHVWIGHSVTVKKGVTIAEGAVIGSNSVVINDVPSNTLVVGNPAEVVRKNVSWEKILE